MDLCVYIYIDVYIYTYVYIPIYRYTDIYIYTDLYHIPRSCRFLTHLLSASQGNRNTCGKKEGPKGSMH